MVCYRVVLPLLHEQLTTRTSGFHAAGNSCTWSPSRSTIPERKETLLMTDKRDKTELLTPTPTVTAPQGGRLVDPCPRRRKVSFTGSGSEQNKHNLKTFPQNVNLTLRTSLYSRTVFS